jgi:CRP-like cAMP-binding protein
MPYEKLLQHINKFIRLSEEEKLLLPQFFQHKVLHKKEHLLKEGQVCTTNNFVAKGVLRLYYITETGTEQIIQFAIDNWWMTDYMSYESKHASGFNIQAVEASELLTLDRTQQENLFQQIPAMERYFRIIVQKAYAASVIRMRYIFTQSGEERFHHFNDSFPDFVQRIPQYMLASYLGFTPEFLSKIRAKK